MRKDIQNLNIILLAIDKVERTGDVNSTLIAENLDSLYSALKIQAKAIVEIQILEELTEEVNN